MRLFPERQWKPFHYLLLGDAIPDSVSARSFGGTIVVLVLRAEADATACRKVVRPPFARLALHRTMPRRKVCPTLRPSPPASVGQAESEQPTPQRPDDRRTPAFADPVRRARRR